MKIVSSIYYNGDRSVIISRWPRLIARGIDENDIYTAGSYRRYSRFFFLLLIRTLRYRNGQLELRTEQRGGSVEKTIFFFFLYISISVLR